MPRKQTGKDGTLTYHVARAKIFLALALLALALAHAPSVETWPTSGGKHAACSQKAARTSHDLETTISIFFQHRAVLLTYCSRMTRHS
eukprot:2642838-Amphidinium_carterae.1